MKRKLKAIISGALAAALSLTALPTLTAQALAQPWEQHPADEVLPPGMEDPDGGRFLYSLTIVAGFNNLPYSTTYDWADVMLGDHIDTMNHYFRSQSYDQFKLKPVDEASQYGTDGNNNLHDDENDGVVHVNLERDHGAWGDLNNMTTEEHDDFQSMLGEAMTAADAYVDYSLYDADNSGTIDCDELLVTIILAGFEYSSRSKSVMKDLDKMSKAHFYRLDNKAVQTLDGKQVKYYVTGSENMKLTSAGRLVQTGIEVLTHETCHSLGLPDMYPSAKLPLDEWYDHRSEALSIMSRPYGVYVDANGKPDEDRYRPYSLDPWSKIKMGWVTPVVVGESGSYTVNATDREHPGNSQNTVLRVNTSNPNEYYLIENRQFTGYDAGMRFDPSYVNNQNGGGIIVWHIDESVLNAYYYTNNLSVNRTFHRPAVMPVFIENDTLFDESHYSFIGDETNIRTGIHTQQSLERYGLGKISLTLYNGCTYKRDRVYANISVTPSAAGQSMSVLIDLNDTVHPETLRKVYLEKTDAVFHTHPMRDKVGDDAYVFAYRDPDEFDGCKDWPGIRMEQVRDNIYCAFLPQGYEHMIFNDGDLQYAAESEELTQAAGEMIYSAEGWSSYAKTQLTPLLGDVNFDNQVDINDATLIQRYLAESATLNRLQKANLDADRNGSADIADATIVQMFAAEKLDSTRSCGKENKILAI